jgi:hypothetical protein
MRATLRSLTPGIVLAALLPASAVAASQPTEHATVGEFSQVVSGSLPSSDAQAGVEVDLTLARPVGDGTNVTIGSGHATTNAAGQWKITLAPVNPATGPSHGVIPGDTLKAHYVAPPESTIPVPLDRSYTLSNFSFGDPGQPPFIASDGSSLTIPGFNIGRPKVKVRGTTLTPTCTSTCSVALSPPVTDADSVTVFFSNIASALNSKAAPGLLGVKTGPPTCSADLVTKQIRCANLNGGQFAISDDGGAPIALDGTGAALVPGLKSGDVVTLDETSPTVTTRHLTTLRVAKLRVDIGADSFAGSCQPDEPLGVPGAVLCPSTGVIPVGLPNVPRVYDDRSGGQTLVSVPALSDLIPAQDASITGKKFTAYADISGAGSTAQILAATHSVTLTIRPHGSSEPVVHKTITPTSDSDGAFAQATVNGLPPGRYIADWVLRDAHGDTHSGYESLFAIQG